MYKFGVLLFFVVLLVLKDVDLSSADSNQLQNENDIVSDVEFQKKLLECKQYCNQQDPKHDAEQTCHVFPERKLVLTDCQLSCLKFTKEEIAKASTCPCVSGRCVGDTKPPQNAAVRYFPEIFGLMFIMYTINYLV